MLGVNKEGEMVCWPTYVWSDIDREYSRRLNTSIDCKKPIELSRQGRNSFYSLTDSRVNVGQVNVSWVKKHWHGLTKFGWNQINCKEKK